MVLVREGLADDDGIRIAQFGEDLLPGASGEKIRIVIGARDIQVGGSKRSGHVFKADLVSAQALDGRNARQFRDLFRQAERNGWMAICGCGTSGTEIEIGGQLVAHPDHDGLAEAPDHDADRGHHRDGSRKRADENGSSAQGGREASRREHRFHA